MKQIWFWIVWLWNFPSLFRRAKKEVIRQVDSGQKKEIKTSKYLRKKAIKSNKNKNK